MTQPRRALALPLLALALLLGSQPASAQESWKQIPIPKLPEFHPQVPKRIVLPNGLVLLLQEDHELPLIDGTVMIRGGSILEPADKVGLADIYGEVWRTGGTTKRTGDELDDFLEARAAKVETDNGSESTTVTFSCLKQDFNDVFSIFAEILEQPAFREDKIGLAKNRMNTAIARRNDEPDQIVARVSTQLAYGHSNPFARVPEYATVAAVTREDLVRWHGTYVHPNNMILGIVGDFDSAAMEQKVREVFGGLPTGPGAPKTNVEFRPAKPGLYFVSKQDVNQSEIRMVEMGIERSNPDYFAVQVMNEAFGGGFASRLFKNLRTLQGLAYSVGGGVGSAYDHPGITRIGMGTKSATTAAGLKGLEEQIDKLLSDPPNQEELTQAKDSILNAFVFHFDSKDKVLREQMTYEFYGYPLDFLDRYRAGVEKVTTAELARVAKKYIHKGQFATVVVGNSEEIGNQLTALGPVTPVDITIPPPPGAKQAESAPQGSNPGGKALIAKVAQALGGEARLQPIKSVRQTAAVLRQTGQGELALEVETLTIFPDRQWTQIQAPMGEMKMVVSPQAAFMAMGGTVRDMPSSQKEDMLQSGKRDLIYIAQHAGDPRFLFSAGEKEKVDGAEAEVLSVNADGVPVKWWVDPASGRILRIEYQRNGMGGPEDEVVDLADWRSVDGVSLPFKRTITENGRPSAQVEIKQMQLNPPADPKLFEKPASTAEK